MLFHYSEKSKVLLYLKAVDKLMGNSKGVVTEID